MSIFADMFWLIHWIRLKIGKFNLFFIKLPNFYLIHPFSSIINHFWSNSMFKKAIKIEIVPTRWDSLESDNNLIKQSNSILLKSQGRCNCQGVSDMPMIWLIWFKQPYRLFKNNFSSFEWTNARLSLQVYIITRFNFFCILNPRSLN